MVGYSALNHEHVMQDEAISNKRRANAKNSMASYKKRFSVLKKIGAINFVGGKNK